MTSTFIPPDLESSSISLPDHVSFCEVGESLVFLDLRQDRYRLIEGHGAAAIRSLYARSPEVSEQFAPYSARKASEDHVLSQLEGTGLIAIGGDPGRSVKPFVKTRAKGSIAVDLSRPPKPPRIDAFASVFQAVLRAHLLRRSRGFEAAVDRIRRGKARFAVRKANNSSCSKDQVVEYIKRYYSSRPFLYTWKDQCFFEALALSLYLQAKHRPVDWVFGVKIDPFAAHCWLESDGLVVNDTAERVSDYTPILVV